MEEKPIIKELNDDGVKELANEIIICCISDLNDCFRFYDKASNEYRKVWHLNFLNNVRIAGNENLYWILNKTIDECINYLINGYCTLDNEYILKETIRNLSAKYEKGFKLWLERNPQRTHLIKQILKV